MAPSAVTRHFTIAPREQDVESRAIFRFELSSGTWSETHMTTVPSVSFTDLDISSDGSRVYVAGALGNDIPIRAYNTSDLQPAPEASGPLPGSPSVVLDSPDGNNLYTIIGSNQIGIYDFALSGPQGVLSGFRTVTEGCISTSK